MAYETQASHHQGATQQAPDNDVQARIGDESGQRRKSNPGSGGGLLGALLLGFTAVFIGVVVVFLLAIGLNGLVRAHNGGRHAASATLPVSTAVVGQLTMLTNHDYNLDAGPGSYDAPRLKGASVGEVTATRHGLAITDADALPLRTQVSSTYQACKALNWTGPTPRSWGSSAPLVIPWSRLVPGTRICFHTTRGGLYVELLTVATPWTNDRITFDVKSWGCLARPHEVAIC